MLDFHIKQCDQVATFGKATFGKAASGGLRRRWRRPVSAVRLIGRW